MRCLGEEKMIHRSPILWIFVSFVAAATAAHTRSAIAQDLNAICRKSINDDRLKLIPASLVVEARRLFELSQDEPATLVSKSTLYRCMDGKVWLCSFGANLVCGKANTGRISRGAIAYCKQNPGADSVPMAATGHDTIFEWKCVGDKPQASGQIVTVDSRGFIAQNWKSLEQ